MINNMFNDYGDKNDNNSITKQRFKEVIADYLKDIDAKNVLQKDQVHCKDCLGIMTKVSKNPKSSDVEQIKEQTTD